MVKSKIHPIAFGGALGAVSSLSAFGMMLMANIFLQGKPFVAAVGTVYLSYTPSFIACIVGALLGFVNAFIGGFVVAIIYNVLVDFLTPKPAAAHHSRMPPPPPVASSD